MLVTGPPNIDWSDTALRVITAPPQVSFDKVSFESAAV